MRLDPCYPGVPVVTQGLTLVADTQPLQDVSSPPGQAAPACRHRPVQLSALLDPPGVSSHWTSRHRTPGTCSLAALRGELQQPFQRGQCSLLQAKPPTPQPPSLEASPPLVLPHGRAPYPARVADCRSFSVCSDVFWVFCFVLLPYWIVSHPDRDCFILTNKREHRETSPQPFHLLPAGRPAHISVAEPVIEERLPAEGRSDSHIVTCSLKVTGASPHLLGSRVNDSLLWHLLKLPHP